MTSCQAAPCSEMGTVTYTDWDGDARGPRCVCRCVGARLMCAAERATALLIQSVSVRADKMPAGRDLPSLTKGWSTGVRGRRRAHTASQRLAHPSTRLLYLSMSDAWIMSVSALSCVSPHMHLRREKTRSAAAELGVNAPTTCMASARSAMQFQLPCPGLANFMKFHLIPWPGKFHYEFHEMYTCPKL